MTATNAPAPDCFQRQRRLTFAPLAWLKLQYFCHAGTTEVAGFAITAKDDLLYVEDFVTVRQQNSAMTVAMDDGAVADYLDRCVDAGLPPQRVMRIWLHTHTGSSAQPSGIDEDTFARVFGKCDWAVMFILSRTGETYARLTLHVGPGASVHLPVAVDWAAWPTVVNDPAFSMAIRFAEWQTEFTANIHRIPEFIPLCSILPFEAPFEVSSPWDAFADAWDWNDLDEAFLEENKRHEPVNNDRRA